MFTTSTVGNLKLPRLWICAILIVQFLIAGFDAITVIECHKGGECWPFILSFLVNLPFSAVLWDLFDSLKIDPSASPWLYGFLFALCGATWWIAISILGKAAWATIAGVFRKASDV
jgi:hypothetical protein